MFKTDLEKRLRIIFDFKKTTFLAPSESFEQDTLFITILSSKTRVLNKNNGAIAAKVTGSLTVFSQDNKLTYGYFNKRIEAADPIYTKGLFFSDIDIDDPASPARLQNIHERISNFTFLYDSQYDPSKGELTELEFGD